MKNNMINKYNKAYFESRDILIPYLAKTIKTFMLKNRLHKVLDVGCGTGLLVKYLNSQNFKAMGCDSSVEGVKASILTNNRKKIVLSRATNLPFKNNSFDLVTSISVIEHLKAKDAEKFLQEAKRVLKIKGYLIIVTPNYASPLRIIQGKNWFGFKDKTHINFYTPKSLSITLSKNGFTTLKEKINVDDSFDSFLPPNKLFPLFVRKSLAYLFFKTPFSIVRNSFWLYARKVE